MSGGAAPHVLPASLGRYRPIGVLGSGAMGVVYRAHDPVIDRTIAIKVMRTEAIEPDQREEFLGRFLQEVRAAARCAHPAIVTVHDFGNALEGDPGQSAPFIVMELIEGGSLAAMLRGPATRARLLPGTILPPVLDALGIAHARGVVHRDLKPANILLTRDLRPKITDFGIARLRAGTSDMALTLTGALVGTPTYMAPEQARGQTVDHRADLFSVGCIFYEMLTGQTPFGGGNVTETILRLAGSEPAPLAPIASVAPHYLPVVKQALAKAPAERFDSADAFAAALLAASGITPAQDLTMLDQTIPGPAVAFSQVNTRHGAGGPWPAGSQVLATFGQELAKYLGPIASTLVRRAAEADDDPDAVCRTLASHLRRPEDRATFLRRCGRADQFGTTPAMPASLPSLPLVALPTEALNAAQSVLAGQFGPIATVMVRKAAANAASQQEFLDALAAQVPNARRLLADLRAAMDASGRS